MSCCGNGGARSYVPLEPRGSVESPAGPIPRLPAALSRRDRLGALRVRLGIRRDAYAVRPGLYCVGEPGGSSPVLVTANYKLSLDHLRSALEGLAVWILVLDTRGINVWCAAGKGVFSAEEIVRRVRECSLKKIVGRRRLILPQLSAPGVTASEVKKDCGFHVLWGPVRASDIPEFLASGMKAGPRMRAVSFSLKERGVLIPVELAGALLPGLGILAACFLLSGAGPGLFSWTRALSRFPALAAGWAAALLSGAALAPLLLPWLPGRAFAPKGASLGALAGTAAALGSGLRPLEAGALVLAASAFSSFLTMNFTGCTPYTSPSGVEAEMRAALPAQLGALFLAAVLWVGGAFL